MRACNVFDCHECGAPDDGGGIGGWGVHTDLWNSVNAKGMLCMSCFEKKLQRKLTADDFSATMDNRTNKNVHKIFEAEGRDIDELNKVAILKLVHGEWVEMEVHADKMRDIDNL